MTNSDDRPEPYPSLDALRKVNDELLASLPDDDSPTSIKLPLSNEDGVREFIRRAVDTGVLLDTAGDRRTAQGLIDYWASSYLTADDERTRPTMSGRRSMVLKPFDATVVDSVAELGERAINALGPKDKDLARWILLRLFRLPEGAKSCEPSPASLETLLALGNEQRVKDILSRLVEAGVVNITRTTQGDLVELRYGALARRWERLRNWVEARVKFRDASLYWLRRDKASGALLGASLWEEAKGYGNLSEVEQEFVQRSRTRSRWFLYGGIGAVMALLLVPSIGFAIVDEIQQRFYIPYKAKEWNEILQSSTANSKKKAEGFRWLTANNQTLNLTAATLADVDVTGIESIGSQFVKAQLTNMTFAKAKLPWADFSQSKIVQGNFAGATLTSSRFDGAVIAATSFSSANLYRSIFDRALFCQGVTFSMTNVRSASFRNVIFDGGHAPRFDRTAWWVAVGWSMTQFEQLRKQTEDDAKEKIKDTQVFKDQLGNFDKRLNLVTEPTTGRADLLNGKAWYLAIYGVNLPDAELVARESLKIVVPGTPQSRLETPDVKIDLDEASYKDTLAYILMQAGKMSDALDTLKIVVTKTPNPLNEWIFRYAVALFAQGQQDEAIKNLTLAMDQKKYVPSHELFLLWPYIKEDPFRTHLEALMKKALPAPSSTLPGCPAVSPAPAG